ncbi:glutamic acid-rich protein isoform X2 [Anabrus simplex]|uniref:glutamic acid-rich protein isoform X2 n=1 Tax=Anabrus simplex TaxID=316456 RepID=UPI0034DD4FEA
MADVSKNKQALDNKEVVTSISSEKKIVKKKKKTEGGESVKTKKTKKNKKADSEKENFSVIGMECETLTTITDNNDLSTLNGENQENLQDDDLLNVSVKELKKTYNSEATKGFNKKACNGTEEIMTGISIEQLKSSFSKFDQLSKKTVLHVRSVDASKVQQQFNQNASTAVEVTNNCRSCTKQVFQMEQVKAEGAVWHKNCFRCKECNKQLSVDNYSSNEGVLYCMPHFKELFKPKAVPEDENEMPSDKPDLGLEELSALNVKSRYQLFEKTEPDTNNVERSPSSVSVKRSPSILSKLARFQAKGMDIGVTDDSLSNVPYEESSSSSEEEEEEEQNEEEGKDVVRANRKQRERPVSFNKMGDIKCKWETGHATKKEERREERKQEIQSIRSRLFMGKQGKMKEMYEQAVQDSERSTQKKDIDIKSEKAKSLKEKFERGEVFPDDDDENDAATKQDQHRKSKEDDLGVFEEGISKKSRSLFLELDAKTQQPPLLMSPVKSPQIKDDSKRATLTPQVSKDIVRASDAVEDVKVETSEIFSKFKFFETYKEPEREKKQFRITPPREGQVKEGSPENTIYRDPSVVRSEDKVEEEIVKAKTASKMLSIFRQMEENATKEELPEGPKPLKRFTPPPDYTKESEDSEDEEDSEEEEEEDEEEEEEETNPNIVRASDKIEDEFLKQATTAARAKALRAKFERWEEKENKLNKASSGCNLDVDQTDQPSIDSTKSLRAKFESLKNEVNQHKERAQPKVNRFV